MDLFKNKLFFSDSFISFYFGFKKICLTALLYDGTYFLLVCHIDWQKNCTGGSLTISAIYRYYYIVEVCIGWNCSMHEGRNECLRSFSAKTGNQNHLWNPGVDWMIIVKRNRRSKKLLCRQESLEPRLRSVTGCCEHCNEILSFINDGKYLELLSNS